MMRCGVVWDSVGVTPSLGLFGMYGQGIFDFWLYRVGLPSVGGRETLMCGGRGAGKDYEE